MSKPTRRNFLKGLGATVASIGVAAAPASAASALALPSASVVPSQSSARTLIAPHLLATLVAEQMQTWIIAGRAFTAYDLTRAIRAHYPRFDILHAAVRPIVHSRMQPVLAQQMYRQRPIMFAGTSAIQYVPV